MTTPSTARKAGPLLGTGSQTAWPFTFKVFAAGDVKVTIANSSGVETVLVLNTDYSVTLNSNQDTSPGGTITYPLSGSALPVGSTLTMVGDLDYDQPLDLPSGGNFSPLAIENELDRQVMQTQQLKEQVDRALKFPVSDEALDPTLPAQAVRAGTVLAFHETTGEPMAGPSIDVLGAVSDALVAINTVATNVADVVIVADNIDDVNTVATNIADVNTVVDNLAAVQTVATDLNEPVSEINTVAVNIVKVNAVGDNITDVVAVADNMTDVNTLVDNLAAVNNVSDAIDNGDLLTDVYQGAHATDPTTRLDGSALQAGDLYFNTAESALRAYSGTLWVSGTAGSLSVQNFSGDATTTAFTLGTAPAGENNTQVYVSGVYQQKDTYSVSGTTLTFSSAPPTGTNNIEVVTVSTLSIGETDAALVSTAPAGGLWTTVQGFITWMKGRWDALTSSTGSALVGFIQAGIGAVARSVQNKLRDVVSVKDFGAVGDGVTDDSAAFIAARAAANGKRIYAPAGTYKLNQSVTGSTDLILEGDGPSTILDFTGTVTGSYNAIEAIGTATQIQNLGATATAGTYTVTFVSAPSLAIGDVFVIFNPTNSSWSGFRTNYFAGEWCEVESISGNTVTVRNQLYDTYTAAAVNVYKISGPRLVLRNFDIRGTTVDGLIGASLCIAPLLENIKASHANNAVVYLDRCFKPTVINPDMSNVGDGGDDYGIVIGSSQHTRIIGGNVYSRRHAITSGGAANVCDVPVRDARIIGTVLKNDTASGVFCADFHGNTEDSSYIDCSIYGGATWQGKDIEFVNCTITSDIGGRVIYSAEIKGGRFALKGCKLITHVDPSATARGIVDIGGNNNAVSANTVLPATFAIENCELYGRNLISITSLIVFKNNGATVKTNFVVDGVKANVNALGNLLYTANTSGTPDADYVILDRIAGFPSGTLLHNSASNAYINFPHRCQRQAGSLSITATSGTNNTIPGYTNFKYVYPRTPVAMVSTAGSATVFNGNKPIIPNIFDLAATRIRPVISTGDAVNWTATNSVTFGWTALIDEV